MWRSCRGWRSRWPCWDSISWATGCGTYWTRDSEPPAARHDNGTRRMRMKTALTDAVRQAEDDAGGRLGCHICDPRGDVWATHRADERFVTASVIKVPILVTLAAAVEAGDHRWSDLVPLDPDDAAAGSG